jgi:hypothetical protein
MVLGGVLGAALRARDANNYDEVNRVIDWGMRYMLGTAEAEGISLETAMEETAKLIRDSPLDEALAAPTSVRPLAGGGLSYQDLRELGVLDEDQVDEEDP